MFFNADQINQFRTQGYVAVPDFWNEDETRAMQDEIERFKQVGLLQNVATDGDSKTISNAVANLQLCPMSPHSELFKALPFAPNVIEAVSELIGDPIVLHLDQVFLKPAKHGAGTNWHQDNAYFKLSDPMIGTAMWTAVHAATIANGTIRVIPGAQYETLEHSRDPDSNHHIRCYPDESRALPIELPAGGAVFFAYGIPHATGANGTDHDRAGAAFHFINKSAYGETNFADKSRPVKHPILSSEDQALGMDVYGVDMSDAWEKAVREMCAA